MNTGQAKRTLYIVAYDIPSDRRRTKVHKLLSGFGRWTQYSLFECFLSERELVQLQHRLDRLLRESEDSVRLYPLCYKCIQRVITMGGAPPTEEMTYIV